MYKCNGILPYFSLCTWNRWALKNDNGACLVWPPAVKEFSQLSSSLWSTKTEVEQRWWHTFVAVDTPSGWLRRIWEAHIILGVDPEMILSPRQDVVGYVRVSEETVCHSLPHSGVGVTLRHHVVQPIVELLVWRGSPWYDHFSLTCLLQLHWPRSFGFI